MKKKLLIRLLGSCFCLTIGGLWFINTYEYQSFLKLPERESTYIILDDTLTIEPFFYIASPTRLDVNLGVEHLSDSILFKSLDVSITSVDDPRQRIEMTHILAYKDTICNEDINSSYVSALSFADLAPHYKAMSKKRDFNSIRFFFETEDVERSVEYKLKIVGTAVYKGKVIKFNKEIRATRKKRFVPIQMMT